ncbi:MULTISPECIES: NACHT domain-containing NTPase [unclassified Leptolyngbya]|uniref:NACHT domain-containing protein n=1 Tax=unclassified Leptolyngbya TaxID=2650499 RepID=UPI0016855812|nr:MULTISPECIES: NACHT domain-containing NTPase [unclassified Leptolyngbya]MBD1913640.1 NACHT domain-containing NTPase [Leptolyngbya sp. FACHB-8]MBD2155501.1 NACHT domain-containing NTPase [Leptolyngbya sp. FACHB-16]
MTGRSLRASAEGIQIIRKAIKRDGWKQDELKDELGLKTRQPITRLLRGEAIERVTFEELCQLLGVRVEDVAVLEVEPSSEKPDMDEMVREMRDRIRPLIQERCGTMRVLDMAQPIGLGEIYTHANILEKITARRGLNLEQLLAQVSPEDFERFSLGGVAEKRVPGLEAVEQHNKLMILGKPGAGKTTFLKHLAIQCIGGQFQADRVPLFVTLKDFAEAEEQPNVLAYLSTLISAAGEGQPALSKTVVGVESLQTLLREGRALILLDGLDEVRETDASRVLRQIQQFSEYYARNAFVITCRIAAHEYIFERFTEVEVADFDNDQIADIAGKWFRCKQDEVRAERFLAALKAHPPIRELASSPLLLMLLCLAFEDSSEFPVNRAEFYKRGVDVLLKKWDVKRNIERDQVYKKLSLPGKENLLSHIAYHTFEAGSYFFKQKDLEQQIREFIAHLPEASRDGQTLELDSEAVLKSIEAQHGLFVECARGIYSFSHLTFHEYFAARDIKEKANFQPLTQNLTEKRWREVVLLTVGMVLPADELLRQLKQATDDLLAKDLGLQGFLSWVFEKSLSTHTSYKSAAVRAFYFTLSFERDYNYNLRGYDCALDNALDCALTRDLTLSYTLVLNFDIDFDRALNRALSVALAYDKINESTEVAYTYAIVRTIVCNYDFSRACYFLRQLNSKQEYVLLTHLENLLAQLPDPKQISDITVEWCLQNIQAWASQLQAVMIEHRNIGYDWHFSDAQKQQLKQYYEANKLLVACLNSDCYVSRGVREEIEETLLLPIAEIKKRTH